MNQIEDCIVFLLGKAQQNAYQAAKKKLKPFEITPVQFAVLHVLWQRDGQLSSELGERIQLDSATMTGLLDRMEKRNLVQRRPSDDDRRKSHIFLTEKGRELQFVPADLMVEANGELLSDFSEEEVQLLKRMLTKIGLRSLEKQEEI